MAVKNLRQPLLIINEPISFADCLSGSLFGAAQSYRFAEKTDTAIRLYENFQEVACLDKTEKYFQSWKHPLYSNLCAGSIRVPTGSLCYSAERTSIATSSMEERLVWGGSLWWCRIGCNPRSRWVLFLVLWIAVKW